MGSGHGGRREGAGRKPTPDPALADPVRQHHGPTSFAERACYARIIEAVNKPVPKEGDSIEIARIRKLFDSNDPRIVLDTIKYFYDHRDGKAIQPVDVDASITGNVRLVNDIFPPRASLSDPKVLAAWQKKLLSRS